jgi:NAD(P)-dependent dehydrogenase (short-subunit alcohol dehydrogenase family)
MLEGRVAVITGAGRGLGRAYAEAMAAAGAEVVVNDIDADVVKQTVDAIRAAGGTAVGEAGDAGHTTVANTLVRRACEEFGQLDIMCANAGVLRDSTLIGTSDEDFDLVIHSHVRATFTCSRAAVTCFKEQGHGGRLILTGSPGGQRASMGQTAYSGAKAAIVGFVRTWAVECARIEVTVNAVVPRALTRMVHGIPRVRRLAEQVSAGAPVPRSVRHRGLGVPEDVAPVVVYLASPAASGITGQCIGVGGDRIAIWSHPAEVAAVIRDGGWASEDVAEVFPASLTAWLQDYSAPPPPLMEPRLPGSTVPPTRTVK